MQQCPKCANYDGTKLSALQHPGPDGTHPLREYVSRPPCGMFNAAHTHLWCRVCGAQWAEKPASPDDILLAAAGYWARKRRGR